jgi:hypothetical protein
MIDPLALPHIVAGPRPEGGRSPRRWRSGNGTSGALAPSQASQARNSPQRHEEHGERGIFAASCGRARSHTARSTPTHPPCSSCLCGEILACSIAMSAPRRSVVRPSGEGSNLRAVGIKVPRDFRISRTHAVLAATRKTPTGHSCMTMESVRAAWRGEFYDASRAGSFSIRVNAESPASRHTCRTSHTQDIGPYGSARGARNSARPYRDSPIPQVDGSIARCSVSTASIGMSCGCGLMVSSTAKS